VFRSIFFTRKTVAYAIGELFFDGRAMKRWSRES